jgi:hypothetical protein
MKINETNVIYSRTVQMRQFEPVVVSISIKAQVDPSDEPDSVIRKIRMTAREQVEMEVNRLKTERIESVDDPKEKSI